MQEASHLNYSGSLLRTMLLAIEEIKEDVKTSNAEIFLQVELATWLMHCRTRKFVDLQNENASSLTTGFDYS